MEPSSALFTCRWLSASLVSAWVTGDGVHAARDVLAEVDVELREALADLREVAHGIYPIELAEGLAAGVAVLAEGAPIPVHIRRCPIERLDPRVEAAAYFAIAEATLRGRATKAVVSVDRVG